MDFEQAQTWRRLSGDAGNYYCSAAEPERETFRKFVKDLLHEGKITVEFEKANGETRAMICTLSDQHGAKYKTPDEQQQVVVESTKTSNTIHAQKVWDCEISQWRSFRWDRLKRIEFTLG